jgi:hypothetical protein
MGAVASYLGSLLAREVNAEAKPLPETATA